LFGPKLARHVNGRHIAIRQLAKGPIRPLLRSKPHPAQRIRIGLCQFFSFKHAAGKKKKPRVAFNRVLFLILKQFVQIAKRTLFWSISRASARDRPRECQYSRQPRDFGRHRRSPSIRISSRASGGCPRIIRQLENGRRRANVVWAVGFTCWSLCHLVD